MQLKPIPSNPLFEDLTGRTFGLMVVVGFFGRVGTAYNWWCRCECGVEKRVRGASLKSGAVKACGHLSREKRTEKPFEIRNQEYQRLYRKKNKEIRTIKLREWRAENPSKTRLINRNWRYKKLFGLSLEQVLQLAQKQGGRCAICETELTLDRGSSALSLDHCHETGAVRGILCRNCNAGLGMFRDTPALMEKAIRYLLKATGEVGVA